MVVTRFPPSPTGFFHIGSARTALFNHLFSEKNDGKMFLRFEDTDLERSKREYEEDIFAGLKWLGIPYTLPEVFRQSERTEVYREYLKKLIEAGKAYEAEESKDGSGKKVIRFKNPNTRIVFQDLIRGEVSFDTTELGDLVIGRSINEPLYHFTVVVDDQDMGVTHVIRGEDHISNTPRQILILEALGFPRPIYAHIPLILAPDRSKLSKRHGAVSINEYRAQGFLAEALINYLALLGWNPGGEQEVYSLAELAAAFEITAVQKGGAIFNTEKLRWFNHQYLSSFSAAEYEQRLVTYMQERGEDIPTDIGSLVPLVRERSHTLREAADAAREFGDMKTSVAYEAALLLQGAKTDATNVKKHLAAVHAMLENIESDMTMDSIKDAIFPYATEHGRASVLWPLRVALSGKEKSPDPFTLAAFLGKETALSRVTQALNALEKL